MKKLILTITAAAGLLAAQTAHDYGGRLIETGVNNLGTVAGTNTYTVSPNPAVVALTQNVSYCGYFSNANTGAATLNINSLGATSIVKQASTALASGDIAATSSHCFLFNGTSLVIDHIDNAGGGGGGSGTVTTVSVVSANGMAGSVANPTTTPAITLSTTATGPLKGTGGVIGSAAAADIAGLFSGCSGTQYLGADGACHSAGGGSSPVSVISTTGALYSGTITSGVTAIGSAGQTCVFTFSDGATAAGILTGTNAIAGGTALTSIVAGSGLASPPTTATVSAGTASSCTGTPVLLTVTAITVTSAGNYYNNTSGALTYLLPTISSGLVGSSWNFSDFTAKSGAITLLLPGATTVDVFGTSYSTKFYSAGAVGDDAQVTAVSTTLYKGRNMYGTWTPQ